MTKIYITIENDEGDVIAESTNYSFEAARDTLFVQERALNKEKDI